LENDSLILHFIVLHAPCLGKNKGDGTRPIDQISDWWRETTRLFASHVTADLVWVFVDANAPLNSEYSPHAGSAGAEPLNPQGRLLGSFLLESSLVAPSTFAHFHQGMHATWTHSNGSKYRRDYVLTSKVAFELTDHTAVLHDFDNTFCHDDHLPLVLHVKGMVQCKVSAGGEVQWDENAFLCPERIAQFQQALATLPIPVWQIDVVDHKNWYERQLLQLGAQFFAKRSKTRTRPKLRPDTLAAIAFKRHLLDCARAWNIVQLPEFKDHIKPVEKAIRAMVRSDLTCFYDQILVQLQQSGSLGDHKTVFRTLVKLGGRNRRTGASVRPLPMLQQPDGTLTQSFLQRQQVWMEQFAALEAGRLTPAQALRDQDKDLADRTLDLQQPKSFPTIWDVQTGLRRLKRGKAPGPNCIPPALLKAGGEIFARQFLALLTKCAAHSHEPLDWKGGRLFPLHKGKLHPSDPQGYRSIFVSDFTAKLYHMTLRRPLEDAWSQSIHSLQLGGRKGQGTDMAHHFLQTYWHWVTRVRRPAALIFFDVRAAFYSVLRETLFPGDGDVGQLVRVLCQLGVATDLADSIAPHVDQDFALDGVSPHILAILKDAMTNTHFYIDGIADPCCTQRGTRPGDPIGDILFNLVMSCLLRDVKQMVTGRLNIAYFGSSDQCRDFSTFAELPVHGCFDISFVDDCAFGVHGTNISQVEEGIRVIVDSMVLASRRRGLTINFEEGKTEALWNLVGKGSRDHKANIAANNSCLTWEGPHGPTALRIVPAYRHLGTWLQIGHVHGKEIQQRSALARATWGALARPFYNKRYVSLHVKAQVFQATALNQFLYNAHIWTGLTPIEWDKWHNALRKPFCLMIRGKLRGINPLHLDMDAACAMAGVLPPKHAVHVARLRYLRRLARHCPQALWNMLMTHAEVDASWISLCHDSFDWFRQFYDVAFAPDTNDIVIWITAISIDTSWNGRVKRAAFSCLQHCNAIAERVVFQQRFSARFEEVGGVLPLSSQTPSDKWQCDLCNRCFPTRKGLAAHAARVHGYKRVERFYATGSCCDACGKFYHARARLLAHLYDCPDCLATLQACFPPIAEADVEQLDAQDKQYAIDMRLKGWWRTKAFAPPVKFSGPLLPRFDTPEARVFRTYWDARTTHPGTAYQELQGHCAGASREQQPEVHLFAQDLPAFILHAPPGPNRGGGALDQVGLARETARLHIKWLVFAHFFSGYRRHNDLHAILEQAPLPDGSQLITISVDLCMQRRDSNLAADSATSWWIARIHAGQLIGAGGGPPCESFTAARFQDQGPRPLRTGQYPDGLPALNAREWQQLRIGSRLVFFIFEVYLELAIVGGCAFIEHPQWPTWAAKHDPASIWATLQARLCKTMHCSSVVSFDQCVVGSCAKKPTTILLLRLDSFRHEMLRSGLGGRCHHAKGAHERLQGRNERGEFRTAVGKVYPPGLNEALGRAIRCFAAQTLGGKFLRSELPEELIVFKQQTFEAPDVVQPDFH